MMMPAQLNVRAASAQQSHREARRLPGLSPRVPRLARALNPRIGRALRSPAGPHHGYPVSVLTPCKPPGFFCAGTTTSGS